VDGAGGKSVFPRMWARMQPVVDGNIVVTLDQTRRAMRLMAEKARVIAEGYASGFQADYRASCFAQCRARSALPA
jgi:threonine dehydratase